uniref:F-box-like protein n=1 Tax=Pithovirus LCPAC101 TaxID=2506586 RepID=A0A481Z2P4_9VIRU|nr:MAG: F-box-like protein [Pithovirus LCPAC101]
MDKSWDNLPDELIVLIMTHLSYENIIIVLCTNSVFERICNNENFWKHMLIDKIPKNIINKIHRREYRKTFMYYEKIVNPRYATVHVVNFSTPINITNTFTFEMLEKHDLVIPRFMKHGDIILVNNSNCKRLYIINISYEGKKLIFIESSIYKTYTSLYEFIKKLSCPTFWVDHWDTDKMMCIDEESTHSSRHHNSIFLSLNRYRNRTVLNFDKNIVSNLEYYGYKINLSNKLSYKSIYAKIEYNNNVYIVFMEDPSKSELQKRKKIIKIRKYRSFDSIKYIKIEFNKLENIICYDRIGFFRWNILKLHNVREGNYAKAIFV